MKQEMSSKMTADFCRELGILVKSGIPLAKALSVMMRDESRSSRERKILEELLSEIRQGQLLSEKMEAMEAVFPPMLIPTFRVAETAGNLDQTACRMGEYYRREYRMRECLKAATIYPKLLAGLILTAVIFLTAIIFPQFEELFASLPVLPLPLYLEPLVYPTEPLCTQLSWMLNAVGVWYANPSLRPAKGSQIAPNLA